MSNITGCDTNVNSNRFGSRGFSKIKSSMLSKITLSNFKTNVWINVFQKEPSTYLLKVQHAQVISHVTQHQTNDIWERTEYLANRCAYQTQRSQAFGDAEAF